MEYLRYFVDLFLHLDKHLAVVVQTYHVWTYLILFLVVFCETGLVVTPILPGDSLLFACGALAASGVMRLDALLVIFIVAAILGDTVNYAIGYRLGPKVFSRPDGRFLKKEYLDRTHAFYEKYGGKTIVFARFVPIVRTFAPFVAGVGRMSYGMFFFYNVVGALAWVLICVLAGYFFGNLPFVKDNFTVVILGIIFVSILPGLIEYIRHKRSAAPPPAAGGGA